MDWQIIVTWFAIAAAGVYLLLRARRAWRGTKDDCSGGCGCPKAGVTQAKPATVIPPEQLVLRKRE